MTKKKFREKWRLMICNNAFHGQQAYESELRHLCLNLTVSLFVILYLDSMHLLKILSKTDIDCEVATGTILIF